MITDDHLRAFELALPQEPERRHLDWANVRVDGPKKVFCSLPPHHEFSNPFVTPKAQATRVAPSRTPSSRCQSKGSDKGAAWIRLAACDEQTLSSALTPPLRHAAPPGFHYELGL